MNPDRLIFVALGIDHHISFIENKHFNLPRIKRSEFQDPVQQCTRCTYNDVRRDLFSSAYCNVESTHINYPEKSYKLEVKQHTEKAWLHIECLLI